MDSVFIGKLRAWSLNEMNIDSYGDAGYWEGSRASMKYILDLPIEELRFIYDHAAACGGGGGGGDYTQAVLTYNFCTTNLPREWHLSEPVIGGRSSHRGEFCGDRLITHDTARYQQAVYNLYSTGVIGFIQHKLRPVICEIGGGIGSMALNLGSRLKNTCYCIIDLPHGLFMIGAHLHANLKEASIYMCTGEDTAQTIRNAANVFDYILIPRLYTNIISNLDISLFLNMLSFQEMPEGVLDKYVGFTSTFNAVLFSDNWSRHPDNEHTTRSVEEIIARYYDLTPSPGFYETLNETITSYYARPYFLTKLHMGYPKSVPHPQICGHIKIMNGRLTVLLSGRTNDTEKVWFQN